MKLMPCEEGLRCQERNAPLQEIGNGSASRASCGMTAIVISIIIQTCFYSHIGVVSIPVSPFDNYSMARTRRLETTPKNCRNVRLFGFRPFELSRMCLKRLSKMHVITCVKAKDLRVPLRGYRSSEE